MARAEASQSFNLLDIYRSASTGSRFLFWKGVGTLFIGAFAAAFTSLLAGRIADALLQDTTDNRLSQLAMAIFTCVFLNYLGNRFGRVWVNKAGIEALGTLHDNAVSGLVHTKYGFYCSSSSGKIASRFLGDFQAANEALEKNLSSFIYSAFICICSIVFMVTSSATFLLILIPTGGVLWVASRTIGKRASASQRVLNSIQAKMLHLVSETEMVGPIVRGLNQSPVFLQEMDKVLGEGNDALLKTANLHSLRATMQSTIVFLLVVTTLWVCYKLNQTGVLTVGEVGAVVTYLTVVLRNLILLIETYQFLDSGFVGIERLREFAELESEESAKSPTKAFIEGTPLLECRDLCVRYPTVEHALLKNIRCTINTGEKIGVYGRTGSGKTTFILALLKLLEPESGELRLRGVDYRDLSVATIRSYFAVMPQESTIFDGTIRENILFSASDSIPMQEQDARIREILKGLNLEQWVNDLPQGLDYRVTSGGANLSHGQRQLLCLARVLLTKPSILILDEATSHIDYDTERGILSYLNTACNETTILMIAHRPQTLSLCDRLFWMDDGTLTEQTKVAFQASNMLPLHSVSGNYAEVGRHV